MFQVYTLAMKSFLVIAFAIFTLILVPTTKAESPTICTANYAPVCGAQQVQCVRAPCYPQYKTYSNSCMLSADKGTYIHEGECTASETGPYMGGDSGSSDTYVPPAGCMAWFDGCNSCSRSTKDGPAMCTMMACAADNQQPGYCRTYETPAPPSGGGTSGGSVSSPPAPAPETPPVVATGTTPEPEKQEIEVLLAQLWSYILSLLSHVF